MSKPFRMDRHSPRRCPSCHCMTMPADDPVRTLTFRSVTCCTCGVEFTRWPALVRERLGVVCPHPQPSVALLPGPYELDTLINLAHARLTACLTGDADQVAAARLAFDRYSAGAKLTSLVS